MCMSCGCGQPNESHGDARNITWERLEESARAANISPQDAARNISEAVEVEAASMSENPQSAS